MSTGRWGAGWMSMLLVAVLAACAGDTARQQPSGGGSAAGGAGGAGGAAVGGSGGSTTDCDVEICDGFDNDCDGQVDEDCPCDNAQQQACYSGSPVTVGVGVCAHGQQTCQGDSWAACVGDTLPTPEICNELDDDCDGQVDEQLDEPCPPIPERCADQFEDVPPGHWAYAYIRALYVHEIVSGCSTSPLLYCPADPTLRRQLAVILVRAMGETPSNASLNAYFSDLTDPLSSPYVNRLYELGITAGCQNGLFCPDEATTRQQGAVFLIRALGESPSNAAVDAYFSDLSGAGPYGYINRLYELGITTGCASGLFCPSDPLLREQAATFLALGFGIDAAICEP